MLLEKILALFKREPEEKTEMMQRALDIAMVSQQSPSASDNFLLSSGYEEADDQTLHSFLYDSKQFTDTGNQPFLDEIDQQLMDDLQNPYIHPGQDIVIDEVYHGIDHGHHHEF